MNFRFAFLLLASCSCLLPMIYDQDELKQAVEQGERKLAERRQRARRQKRRGIVALVLAGVALVLGGGMWLVARATPSLKTPVLVVTWPKSKISQVMASGQTVVAREGQPFNVSLSDAAGWNVSWASSGVQNTGDSFAWAPQKNGASLVAQCHAQSSGWASRLFPTTASHSLTLQAVTPQLLKAAGNSEPFGTQWHYARTLPKGSQSAWVFPLVQASSGVAWDERALPALSDVSSVVPSSSLAAKMAGTNPAPAPALWQIVSDFNGGSQTSGLDVTYASLRANDLETVLPRVGARLVQLAPNASIKWIVRLDKTPPEGIVRLSFDGKQGRQAWIKRPGQTTGTPITGWEGGQWKGLVPLEVPTPTPAARQ